MKTKESTHVKFENPKQDKSQTNRVERSNDAKEIQPEVEELEPKENRGNFQKLSPVEAENLETIQRCCKKVKLEYDEWDLD